MAYSIEFAPSAHEQILKASHRQQRRIISKLEKEAASAQQIGDRNKQLKRTRVDDQRLVYLELHPQQQLLVLKIADRADVYNQFSSDDEGKED